MFIVNEPLEYSIQFYNNVVAPRLKLIDTRIYLAVAALFALVLMIKIKSCIQRRLRAQVLDTSANLPIAVPVAVRSQEPVVNDPSPPPGVRDEPKTENSHPANSNPPPGLPSQPNPTSSIPLPTQEPPPVETNQPLPCITTETGCRFEGVQKNGRLEGRGKITFNDGTIYEGIFKDGCLVEGEIRGHNGEVIKGKFEENFLIKGTMTFANGDFSEGEFRNNKLNGKGKKYKKALGTLYEGTFKDDDLDGPGKVIRSGHLVYQGMFQQGRLINGPEAYQALRDQKGQE